MTSTLGLNDKRKPFVMAAALPRSASTSLKIALEMLGFGPCLHMSTFWGSTELGKDWVGALSHPDKTNFRYLMDKWGFGACTDEPAVTVTKQILRDIPESKFIIVTREPKAWWNSLVTTIFRTNMDLLAFFSYPRPSDPFYWFSRVAQFTRTYNFKPDAMDNHIKEMRELAATRPDQPVLEYSVVEGWGPLCKFLEVPVPDVPFPRVNDMKEFNERYDAGQRQTIIYGSLMYTIYGGLFATSVYYLPTALKVVLGSYMKTMVLT